MNIFVIGNYDPVITETVRKTAPSDSNICEVAPDDLETIIQEVHEGLGIAFICNDDVSLGKRLVNGPGSQRRIHFISPDGMRLLEKMHAADFFRVGIIQNRGVTEEPNGLSAQQALEIGLKDFFTPKKNF